MIRPGVRGGNGRILGYIDYFAPIKQDKGSLTFINYKSVFGDKGDKEYNIGIGYRQLLSGEDAIYGGNFFYDARYSPNNVYHHQLGFGLEALIEDFDFRTNFYFPVSDKELISETTKPVFTSTKVVNRTTQTYEEPLRGFDYEMGYLLPVISDVIETRIYAGGYHYNSDLGDDVDGFRGRLEVSPSPMLTAQFELKYDDTIDTDYFAGGYINLPFEIGELFRGKNPFKRWRQKLKIGKKRAGNLRERMTDPVIRDIDITSSEASVVDKEEALVDNIIYVNNTNDSDSLENGTYEHPYNTLAEALTDSRYTSGAWIYVANGDGTATGYTGNFTLGDNVVLWGEGYQAFSGLGGGTYPIIDGDGSGKVITLGRDNTVQGLIIQNAVDGVSGSDLGTLLIRNNVVSNNSQRQIILDTVTAGNHTVTIENSTINNGTVGIRISATTDVETVTATIQGNTVTGGSNNSIIMRAGAGSITLTVSNNTARNSTGAGLRFNGLGVGDMTATVSSSTFTGNDVGVRGNNVGTGTMTIDLGGGTLSSSGQNSIFSNTTADVRNDSDVEVKAENNYWGGADGTFAGADSVDSDPYLTTDPN